MAKTPKAPLFAPRTAGFYPDTKDPSVCIDVEKAKFLLVEYTEEHRMLATERDNPAALTRRTEISREMKKLSDFIHIAKAPVVRIVLPQDMKEPIVINDRRFLPGEYELPVSVAATVLHMESMRRRAEANLFKNNGDPEAKFLGNVGAQMG